MRLQVHGKHFHLDGKPHFLRTVTYGPFPPGCPHHPAADFPEIRTAGFDSIRVYSLPGKALLDEAAHHGLLVIPTHAWAQGCDFIARPSLFHEARNTLLSWLANFGRHPALGALLVGNEIPSDLARWMGAHRVNEHLDDLIRSAQEAVPGLPVGYANFPSTEYLEPPSADFTAFNIYLEDPEALASYLPRLHHLAGDRPVYLTEFGMDTHLNSEEDQARLLPEALRLTRQAGLAGATIYAWSDHWFNNGQTISDWSFGLLRRDGSPKPALGALRQTSLPLPVPENPPRISVIICTHNGFSRLRPCLDACRHLDYPDYEIIVVNDGSTDQTAELLDREKNIRAFHLDPCGLSAARNYGARQATGEILAYTDDDCRPDSQWLAWLAHTYATTDHVAIGGPNLSPTPDSLSLALTTAAPGAPTHVMLNDTLAEHLPGCHLSVRKSAFDEIGGFDPIFRTAGDDVDFCWRLRDAGHTLGFCGASFVWHHRRATPKQYLKQQMGYGQAEALLFKKHPHRFSEGGIRWEGVVYQGSALAIRAGDTIYAGPTGEAGYQSLAQTFVQPTRALHRNFNRFPAPLLLNVLTFLQKHLRRWNRKRHGGPGQSDPCWPQPDSPLPTGRTLTFVNSNGLTRHHLYRHLLGQGWEPSDRQSWDLCSNGIHLRAASEQTGTTTNQTFVALTSANLPSGFLVLAREADFKLSR
ncbi:MAG: glycosyltransferase [Akkermansiaceae bacterium]